jgi:transposase
MCELLVGLPAVNVLGVDDERDEMVVVHIESRITRPGCPACGTPAWVKDRPPVVLVDLPCFGRPARLVWHKHRWRCPDDHCTVGSWTGEDPRMAPVRGAMTDRAGRWSCEQVGRLGRTVAEVARELGCDWHAVNDAVIAYGTPLVEDPDRIGEVEALGLDETLFRRQGRWRTKPGAPRSSTSAPGTASCSTSSQVAALPAPAPGSRLATKPGATRSAFGVLDLSGPYRKTFEETLAHVTQVADPFHLIRLANSKLDECRRRVQNETVGHRGRKDDPLYRARRLLTKAHGRLDERGDTKLRGLLDAGDPQGEVRTAWHAKEVTRSIYEITDPQLAGNFVEQLGADLQDDSCPAEVCSLGRTIARWRDQIVAWHQALVSNGPTEAVNNLIKRIKRIGFGLRRFTQYRIRVLLYAGNPNWDLLATVTPRWGGMPPGTAAGRRSGCGSDRYVEAQLFELAGEAPRLALGIVAAGVVVLAELPVGLAGGEHVPRDHQHRVDDGDRSAIRASPADDPTVSGRQERGLRSGRRPRCFDQGSAQPAVAGHRR